LCECGTYCVQCGQQWNKIVEDISGLSQFNIIQLEIICIKYCSSSGKLLKWHTLKSLCLNTKNDKSVIPHCNAMDQV